MRNTLKTWMVHIYMNSYARTGVSKRQKKDHELEYLQFSEPLSHSSGFNEQLNIYWIPSHSPVSHFLTSRTVHFISFFSLYSLHFLFLIFCRLLFFCSRLKDRLLTVATFELPTRLIIFSTDQGLCITTQRCHPRCEMSILTCVHVYSRLSFVISFSLSFSLSAENLTFSHN